MRVTMKKSIKSYLIKGIGEIWVVRGPKGICKIGWGIHKKNAGIRKTRLSNKLPSGPLDLSAGTPFQQKVWRQIKKIPKGQTRSYAWLAKMAGKPKAFRAAANACGANPIPILIPCHRVIRSDGSIGGFSGPLRLKKLLLRREGVCF